MKFEVVSFLMQSSNITRQLNQMQDNASSFTLLTSVIQLAVAIVFLGLAIAIYWFKIRNVKDAKTLWKMLAAVLGLFGVLFLLGFIFGLFIYFATPSITRSMMYG
ncbi:MAG: hypothetical protein ACP5N9_05620 [Candidatus Bilamarchaeum sp.]|jgi:energy-coupling factor transporter transmembrane protein EcfT